MAAATVADCVGRTLASDGIEQVFGLVGSGNFVVTAALVAGGATFHAARHEGGAVAMADGYARVTGRVGVVTLHQGPGLTNGITALGEAVKCRTPLLVLAGDTAATARSSNFRIDQHDLVESVGAVAERVHSPETAAADAARALRRAEVDRRPVVLMLPVDVQQLPAVEGADPVRDGARPSAPEPAPEAVAAACELIAGAARPVIIAGRGAVLADARAALEALGDRIGALFATSAMAKGLFAGNPHDLEISGGFSAPRTAELLRGADLVVAVGAGLNHWTTRHGALIGADAAVIQIDDSAEAIGRNVPPDVAVVADAGAAARAIDAELARRGHTAAGYRSEAPAQTLAGHGWRDLPYDDAGDGRTIDPRTLSIGLAETLPSDAMVVVDSGHFAGWPAMFLPVADPRSWVFCNGFQAVGLGLGAAIGAAVARPQALTVAIVGDGGFMMALPELETAVRLGLRLAVVVYDDEAYGAEVHHFGPMGHDLGTVRFPAADLVGFAHAAGADGAVVRSRADLAELHGRIATLERPLVIDAKVAPDVRADWIVEAFREG